MAIRALRDRDLEQLLSPQLALAACEQAFKAVASHVWHPASYERLDLGGRTLVSSLGFDDSGASIRFERCVLPPPRPAPASGGGSAEGGPAAADLITLCKPAGNLLAVMPWAPIERVRASAIAALATKHLANEKAPCLAVVGTGAQARLHVRAVTRVRDVKRVLVAGRTEAATQAFTAALAREFGGGMSFEATDVARAASLADVLCLCTDSRAPVLLGNDVRRGCHVNATGATTFDAREVDTNTVLRAKTVIEDKELGVAQGGDLRIPVEEGRVKAQSFDTDLGDLVTGKKVVRASEDDITLFKAVGHPAVDFYLALAAYEAGILEARRRGLL